MVSKGNRVVGSGRGKEEGRDKFRLLNPMGSNLQILEVSGTLSAGRALVKAWCGGYMPSFFSPGSSVGETAP